MKIIRKADIFLALFLIAIGISSSLYISMSSTKGSKAVIYLNGEVYGTYNLSKDRKIKINEKGKENILEIKNKKVSMKYSNCHNQECVKMGNICRSHQSIVCLPNKLVVKIDEDGNEKKSKIDIISD